MGQVRHGSTTHAVRAAIQRSQVSLPALSRELGINPKTVAKWRKRATVENLKHNVEHDLVADRTNVERFANGALDGIQSIAEDGRKNPYRKVRIR